MKTVIQLLVLVTALFAFMSSGLAQGGSPGAGKQFATHGASQANVLMEGLGETDADGNFITSGDCWIRPQGGEWQRDGKWRKNGKNIESYVPDIEPDPIYTYYGAGVSANQSGDLKCHTDPYYNGTWKRA